MIEEPQPSLFSTVYSILFSWLNTIRKETECSMELRQKRLDARHKIASKKLQDEIDQALKEAGIT